MARLGDICEIVSGTTPKTNIPEFWDGEINWITPAELNDDSTIIYESQRKITEKAVQSSGLKPFPAGTVILSSRAPIGKVAIAGVEMYCNQGFKNLICSEHIYNKYLFWFLKSKTDYLNSLVRGATFKEISKSIVEGIDIPLPALETQQFIATLLDKISDLIALRKQQLDKLDELVKARFVEMFGDPIKNNLGLPTKKLGKICALKAGITTSADLIHEQSSEYSIPCYGGNGIRGYVNVPTQNGIYPIIGRQGALCGNVQLASGKFHATEHAVLVTPLIETNIIWLFYLLKYMDLYRFHTGAAQPGLAVKTLNLVGIPCAEIAQQNKFANFAEHIEKCKLTIQQGLDKLEMMKKALMQQYFGGGD